MHVSTETQRQRGGDAPEGQYSAGEQQIIIIKKEIVVGGRQGLDVAGKFVWLAAQGNIDLTCNYWKGTRKERTRQGGKDVESRRQPRSAAALCQSETLQKGSLVECVSVSVSGSV